MRKAWLLPLLAVGLYASDITGKWSGTIAVEDPSSGTVINTPVKAEFAQKPDQISGKIGRKEDQRAEPIRNAKLDGKNLVFDVESEETSGAMKFKLIVLADDRIEGEMKGMIEDGPISGKVMLEKVK